MNNFRPIPPLAAAQAIERAGLGDGARVLVDFAAGGMVKGYARLTESFEVTGRTEIRDQRIPRGLWRRIAAAGRSGEILFSIKISFATDATGPVVDLTGIRIDEVSLLAEIDRHAAPLQPGTIATARAPSEKKAKPPRAKATRIPNAANPNPVRSAKPDEAIFATVKRTMALLGLGRTKINELMSDGTLVRVKFGGATRITMDSVRALLPR